MFLIFLSLIYFITTGRFTKMKLAIIEVDENNSAKIAIIQNWL
tara:strand:+ start:331 stop:459 length:129 start_codon:yes stop_codon:yes gene_type:complete